jgi:hypothetical protein
MVATGGNQRQIKRRFPSGKLARFAACGGYGAVYGAFRSKTPTARRRSPNTSTAAAASVSSTRWGAQPQSIAASERTPTPLAHPYARMSLDQFLKIAFKGILLFGHLHQLITPPQECPAHHCTLSAEVEVYKARCSRLPRRLSPSSPVSGEALPMRRSGERTPSAERSLNLKPNQ